MRKFIMLSCLLIAVLSNTSHAQMNNGNNIMTQPLWGPVGYDYVEYYYLPDIDAYYNVPGAQYVYLDKKHWVIVKDLPLRYKNFNFYGAHKVVMNEPKPYMNYRANKVKYAQYRGQHDQIDIRESHDQKYLAKADHPEHGKWVSPQDMQDQQNRQNEQNRVTAQNKQDSLNRVNLTNAENQHNAQDMQNRQQLQNNENSHKH
ncbi:MAG: hypothetical protein H0X33_08750 [Taibaiella sp.]|nr:hypothetical protein [Taibaiella sp.]